MNEDRIYLKDRQKILKDYCSLFETVKKMVIANNYLEKKKSKIDYS